MRESSLSLMARIDELLATTHYEWARRTLEGIHERVRVTGIVTLRQQETVDHVIVGRLKHDVRE